MMGQDEVLKFLKENPNVWFTVRELIPHSNTISHYRVSKIIRTLYIRDDHIYRRVSYSSATPDYYTYSEQPNHISKRVMLI